MQSQKKIEEGLEHIRAAEKSLKTSLLKWRPDYDNAADEYNKAATCFRNAKALDQCKEALLKAAECHKQNRGIFYAAKALDQAILVCKETGDVTQIPELADRAAHMFQSHGSAESAAATLDKAGKILETQYPSDALRLFQRAAEISTIQDSARQAAEYISKVARLHVKLKEYDKAADAIRRELGLRQETECYQAAGRLTVALVLVQIARGDIVAAEKAFKEWGNYCEASEVQTLERLLTAYDEEDADMARQALNDPFIKHMDVEYAILARDMPVPETTAVKSANRVSPPESLVAQGSGHTASNNIAADEDDYESGGLC